MKYPNITLGRVEAVWNKHGGEYEIDRFLRGELVLVEAQTPITQEVWQGLRDGSSIQDKSGRIWSIFRHDEKYPDRRRASAPGFEGWLSWVDNKIVDGEGHPVTALNNPSVTIL